MRCGEECGLSCTCGAGGEVIGWDSDTWCCGGEQCSEKYGHITCAVGSTLPLTVPFAGRCNDYPDIYGSARQYKMDGDGKHCVRMLQKFHTFYKIINTWF